MRNYGVKEWFKAHPEQGFISDKKEKKTFNIEKEDEKKISPKEEEKTTIKKIVEKD